MAPANRPAPVDPCALTVADIDRLEVVHALLSTLNDPAASAVQLARHAEQFPPLKARIVRDFTARYPSRRVANLADRIALLGNRNLEALLLQLLEDLTELKAMSSG